MFFSVLYGPSAATVIPVSGAASLGASATVVASATVLHPGIDTLVDSFTGADGAPLDSSKWTINAESGTVGADIQGNRARVWAILDDASDAYEDALLDSVGRFSLVNKTLLFKWDISQVGKEYAELGLFSPLGDSIGVFVDDANGSTVRWAYINTLQKSGSSFQWDITQPLWWKWRFNDDGAGGVFVHIETSPTGYDNWTVREVALSTDPGFDVNDVRLEFAIYGDNYATPGAAMYIDEINITPSPALGSFVEEFDDPALPQWRKGRGTPNTFQGALSDSGEDYDLFSLGRFDLRGGDRLVTYAQVFGGQVVFGLLCDDGQLGEVFVDRNADSFRVASADEAAECIEPYDLNAHAWLSLRYDAAQGSIVIETSPRYDGTEVWTQQGVVETGSLSAFLGEAFIHIGVSGDASAFVDHINTPFALFAPVSGSATLGASSSSTGSASRTRRVTGTLTGTTAVTVAAGRTQRASSPVGATSVVACTVRPERRVNAPVSSTSALAATAGIRVSRGLTISAVSSVTAVGRSGNVAATVSAHSSTSATAGATRTSGITSAATAALAALSSRTRTTPLTVDVLASAQASGTRARLGGAAVSVASTTTADQSSITLQTVLLGPVVGLDLRNSTLSAIALRTQSGASVLSSASAVTTDHLRTRPGSPAAIAAHSTLFLEGGSGPTNGYGFVRPITVDHTKVADDLTNFPILVTITHPLLASVANGGHVTSELGHDILITSDVSGFVTLDHEIESYDPATGALRLWVRVPALSSSFDTTLYLFYGNEEITTSQQNAAGVWSSGYAGVYHLGKNGVLSAEDSTAYNNHGVLVGGVTGISGPIGEAASFGTTRGNYIDLGTRESIYTALNGSFTIDLWVNIPDGSQILWGSSGPTSNRLIGYDAWSPNSIVFNEENIGMALLTPYTPYLDGWHKLTWRFDAATNLQSSYVDGQLVSSGTYAFTAPFVGAYSIGDRSGTYPLLGRLDEVRVASVARSPGWLQTEYANQNDPATFTAIGVEQVQSAGTSGGVVVSHLVGASTSAQSTTTVVVERTLQADVTLTASSAVGAFATNGNVAALIFSGVSVQAQAGVTRSSMTGISAGSVATSKDVRARLTTVEVTIATSTSVVGVRVQPISRTIRASSGLTSDAVRVVRGASSLASVAGTEVGILVERRTSASLSSAAMLSALPQGGQSTGVTLSATALVTTAVTNTRRTAAVLASSAQVTAGAVRTERASSSLSSTGIVTAQAGMTQRTASAISASASSAGIARRTSYAPVVVISSTSATTKAGRATKGVSDLAAHSSLNVATDGTKFGNASLSAYGVVVTGATKVFLAQVGVGARSAMAAQAQITRGVSSAMQGAATAGSGVRVTRLVRLDAGATAHLSATGDRARLVLAQVVTSTTVSTTGQRTRDVSLDLSQAASIIADGVRDSHVIPVIDVQGDLRAVGFRTAFAEAISSSFSTLICPGLYVPVLSVPGSNNVVLRGLKGRKVTVAQQGRAVTLPRETPNAAAPRKVKLVVVPRR